MTIQNITVKRNQLWRHEKGNLYRIYGIATEFFNNQNTKYVLYYQIYDELFEKKTIPNWAIDVETLEKISLVVENVNDPLNNLYLNFNIFPEIVSDNVIKKLKEEKHQFLWARKLNDFLEIDENGVKRFS